MTLPAPQSRIEPPRPDEPQIQPPQPPEIEPHRETPDITPPVREPTIQPPREPGTPVPGPPTIEPPERRETEHPERERPAPPARRDPHVRIARSGGRSPRGPGSPAAGEPESRLGSAPSWIERHAFSGRMIQTKRTMSGIMSPTTPTHFVAGCRQTTSVAGSVPAWAAAAAAAASPDQEHHPRGQCIHQDRRPITRDVRQHIAKRESASLGEERIQVHDSFPHRVIVRIRRHHGSPATGDGVHVRGHARRDGLVPA